MIMLDDAVRANGKEEEVRVLDLSQMVEESLRAPADRAGFRQLSGPPCRSRERGGA